jgi:hypothetical protein
MKKQLIRAAATSVLGLSLTTGFAAADIGNTGYSSHNSVKSTVSNSQQVKNNNNVGASSSNYQTASTGKATSEKNTTGGDATSGDASNGNDVSLTATVDNTSSDGAGSWTSSDPSDLGSINQTGADSQNTISSQVTNKTDITNNNNVSVSNSNNQSASTGSANVSENTTGGSATSGDASNTAISTIDLSVSN